MWILERRFPEDFGRREYRNTNAVTENKNVEIIVKDSDVIRKQILAKLTMVRDYHESSNGWDISSELNLFYLNILHFSLTFDFFFWW